MLTEYSSLDDIRAFRDKTMKKIEQMLKGWLGCEIRRKKILWKKQKEKTPMTIIFTIDNQKVGFDIIASKTKYGRVGKNSNFSIYTQMETKNGKIYLYFSGDQVDILTPHFRKRYSERFCDKVLLQPDKEKEVPYKRNGNDYILYHNEKSVAIIRPLADDVRVYVTFLHIDMCTSKNYQELLKMVGKKIDEIDIYEWK